MNDQHASSITRYLASVDDIEELMGICIGLLGESQSMSPEDRAIAANLLGDAAAIAAEAATNERARLLRITEAAIGGVAVGDSATIAALFQRHKTELERLRRKAASAVESAAPKDEPARAHEPAQAPTEEPAQVPTDEAARAATTEQEAASMPEQVTPVAMDPPAEAPAAQARKRAPGRKKSAK